MGAGPAALCIVAELVEQGLAVTALASHTPEQPWPNTYGIWAEELESLGMASLLGQRWTNTVSYFGDGDNEEGLAPIQHHFDYGLFDPAALQDSLLSRCGELSWNVETAVSIKVLGEIRKFSVTLATLIEHGLSLMPVVIAVDLSVALIMGP